MVTVPGLGWRINSTQLRIRSVEVLILSVCSIKFSSSESYSVVSALPNRSRVNYIETKKTVIDLAKETLLNRRPV